MKVAHLELIRLSRLFVNCHSFFSSTGFTAAPQHTYTSPTLDLSDLQSNAVIEN